MLFRQTCNNAYSIIVITILPNYIFTYNGNQYVRVTPYAYSDYTLYPDTYRFSDDSQIGQVKAANGNSSNYRFFEIQPIKWIVLNYKDISDKSLNGGDKELSGVKEGELYELLANDVLVSGIAPTKPLWKDNTINRYLNNVMINEMFTLNAVRFAKPGIIYNNTSSSDYNLIETGSNSNYLANGSNSTTQNLYLLSFYEVSNSSSPYILNGIFGTNSILDLNKTRSNSSDYAKAHYQPIQAATGKANFWFRTTNGTNVFFSSISGTISNYSISTTHIGTRPAMQRGQECPF